MRVFSGGCMRRYGVLFLFALTIGAYYSRHRQSYAHVKKAPAAAVQVAKVPGALGKAPPAPLPPQTPPPPLQTPPPTPPPTPAPTPTPPPTYDVAVLTADATKAEEELRGMKACY